MRSNFAPRGGLTLLRTPSARQEATRRWLAMGCGLAGLALASGLLGTILQPTPPPRAAAVTGPLSYISSP